MTLWISLGTKETGFSDCFRSSLQFTWVNQYLLKRKTVFVLEIINLKLKDKCFSLKCFNASFDLKIYSTVKWAFRVLRTLSLLKKIIIITQLANVCQWQGMCLVGGRRGLAKSMGPTFSSTLCKWAHFFLNGEAFFITPVISESPKCWEQ